MSDDCIFCRIIAGEIPSEGVLERENLLAFRDVAPAAPTHVLVVPREHFDVRDVTAERGALLAEMVAVAAEVARLEGVDGSGYRMVLNVGPDAGQTIFHLHMHVLGGAPLGPVAR